MAVPVWSQTPKSNAGRKPYDTILKFKIVLRCTRCTISLTSRPSTWSATAYSFMRFLDLELEGLGVGCHHNLAFSRGVGAGGPDRQSVRAVSAVISTPRATSARGGQIIDATIVPVPKQRNTKDENEAIKAGKTPEGWK